MPMAVEDSASDDRDISEWLRAGERERALQALLKRYEGRIYRLCLAMLRSPGEAEDAAQESLVRIWKGLASYDGRAALSTWIYAITRNRCLTALSRRRVSESLSDPQVESEVGALTACEEREEDRHAARVRALVEALPEPMRRVLVLYYFEGRSVEEVARMLACPGGTVKARLFRARALLMQRLQSEGVADPALWLENT